LSSFLLVTFICFNSWHYTGKGKDRNQVNLKYYFSRSPLYPCCRAGTKTDRKKDSTQEYDGKAMSPAKIRKHEPTAVSRDSDQKILEGGGGQTGTRSEEAKERR
jgi:hypothetical protein